MQAGNLVKVCRRFNELFLKNHKLAEGDHILLETVSGIKDTFVKGTTTGRLFAEAVEFKKTEEIITLDIRELGSAYLVVPSFEMMVDLAVSRGWHIVVAHELREITDEYDELIFRDKRLSKIQFMEELIKHEDGS